MITGRWWLSARLLLLCGALAGTASAQERDLIGGRIVDPPLKLVRCHVSEEPACFQLIGNFVDVSNGSGRLRGHLDSAALIGPGLIRSELDAAATIKLLVAYDVSGSMLDNAGFDNARIALAAFLGKLPPSVTVAVVPFESRRVRARFQSARFLPVAEAITNLRKLPRPDRRGNTALYQAVFDGLQTLDRNAAPEDQTFLLVLTDGKNDVDDPRADDPGLLDGEAGLNTARGAVEQSRHRVWMLGAGNGVDMASLSAIVGSKGRARTVPMEADLVGSALDAIKDEMTPRRILVYGIPASVRVELGRRRRLLLMSALGVSAARWRPPLVALPPFDGEADSTLVPHAVRELAGELESDLRQRLLVGVPLLLVVLVAYLALPRIIGAPSVTAAPEPQTVKAPKSAPSKSSQQLRPVTEAPIRRPTDITKDRAIR